MEDEIEDGDVAPPARLGTFGEGGEAQKWPSFAIQTAQDDLRVRASQRDAKRAGVEEQRARKAARLRQDYDRKVERVRLFKESQRALKRKVRDMNVVHAKERSRLREHLSSLRSKGMSVLSSSSSVFNGAHSSSTTRASTANATVSSSSSDALTILRKSLESSLGLRAGGDSSVGMGSSFSPSNSALPRAATAGSGVIRGGRRKQVRGTGRRRNRRRQQQQQGEKQSNSEQQQPHGDNVSSGDGEAGVLLMSHSRVGGAYVPDGGSFYDFAGASKVGSSAGTAGLVTGGIDSLFDISKHTSPQDFMFGSVLSGGTNPQQASDRPLQRHGGNNSSNNSSQDVSGSSSGATAPFLTSSALLDFSSTSIQRGGDAPSDFTKMDAETGESIVLRSSSVASLPRSWSPKKGSNNGTRYDYEGKGQTAATGEGSRHARQQPQNQQQQQSHPQSGAYLSGTTAPSSASVSSFNRQRPATTTVLSGGSSLGLSTPFIHGRSLCQRTRRSQGNLRAQTAGPVARSTGFLKGPDARRMMARRAKHVSLGQLAPRDLMFPKPTTFWQKEWAANSEQYQAQSSVHVNGNLLRSGLQHISELRNRQMQDMERLIKIERDEEVERQAKAVAEKDPARLRRLHELSLKARERSRNKILRVAREHELSLASRMASLGVIR